MKVAVMQPYLFPYIGYFQLIAAVDVFVIFNDVNFIKKGWLNRNSIIVNNTPCTFTFPVSKVSQNKKIFEHSYLDLNKSKQALLKTVHQTYKNSPFYSDLISILEKCFECDVSRVDIFNQHSLIVIAKELGLKTQFVLSTDLNVEKTSTAQQRIIDICKKQRADKYVNLPGGKDLYLKDEFLKQGIELEFISPKLEKYQQNTQVFQPYMSVLDIIAQLGLSGLKTTLRTN